MLIGFLMAEVLRFWGVDFHIIRTQHSIWKSIVSILVIQIAFYYFDLYDPKNFRINLKMSFLVLESLGVSFLLLAILYYSFPTLAIGRGILAISLIFIFVMAFLWRGIYARLWRKMIRERILIVGTGELSEKVTKEIYENGQDSFEIIGFVAE